MVGMVGSLIAAAFLENGREGLQISNSLVKHRRMAFGSCFFRVFAVPLLRIDHESSCASYSFRSL